MKKPSIVCGLLIASGSLFAQQYTISTVAGTGVTGWSGDAGPALSAQFHLPIRVAVDSSGTIYLNDYGNLSIRIISPNGTVNTLVGTSVPGYSGDGAPSAIGGQISSPHDIALDSSNRLYIADTGNYRVRVLSGGKINTFAGNGTRGVQGSGNGDGGQATSASFITPTGVAVDKSGNVYISDIGNATVRKVTPDGIIRTIAGTGFLSFGAFHGEGGPATSAILGIPYSLTTDNAGNVYIVDTGLARLFRIDSDGTIHTVQYNFPGQSCSFDTAGNLYVADPTDNVVEKITPNGTVLWIGGDGVASYLGDGAVGTTASMNQPYGLALDASGNIYVAEAASAVVRKLSPVPFSIGAVANAATNKPFVAPAIGSGDATVPISPGEIVTLFGTGLGPTTLVSNVATNGQFPTSLAGTSVTIGGVAAPIIYTSSTFVSAIVPYAVDGLTSTNVFVTYNGKNSVTTTVPVAPTAPGLFTYDSTGSGSVLALNVATGQLNTAATPAKVGDFVVLYATGEGQTSPNGIDGKLASTTSPAPSPIHSVTATVNGTPAVLNYSAGAPGLVAGVMQVNLQIPTGVASGAATVQLLINNNYSPAVTINVQ